MTRSTRNQSKEKHETAESQSTSQKEQRPDSPRKPKKKYEIDIFRDWCKSCGICAAFCPRECIEMDENGSPVVKNSERCTGCGWCELHCPDFAISVRPRKPKDNAEPENM